MMPQTTALTFSRRRVVRLSLAHAPLLVIRIRLASDLKQVMAVIAAPAKRVVLSHVPKLAARPQWNFALLKNVDRLRALRDNCAPTAFTMKDPESVRVRRTACVAIPS